MIGVTEVKINILWVKRYVSHLLPLKMGIIAIVFFAGQNSVVISRI